MKKYEISIDRIQYEPDVELDEFESKLRNSQDRDMRAKMTSV